MSNDHYLIKSNAHAFIETIERMTPKQKEQQPSGQYGKNFNSILEQAKAVATSVGTVHWPEPVEVYEGGMIGDLYTKSTFAEMETYARQIDGLLRLSAPATPSVGGPSRSTQDILRPPGRR